MQDTNATVQTETAGDINSLVTQIITAYTGHNTVSSAELPQLVRELKQALMESSGDVQISFNDQNESGDELKSSSRQIPDRPAVAIKNSIKPDGIISMIDGRKYKTLKRHLGTHGLTPDQYRQRYNLPDDYPMVAPEYSERRSELAKQMGLGTDGRRGSRPRRGNPGNRGPQGQANNPTGKNGR